MEDPEFMSLLNEPVNGKRAEDLALQQRISFYTVDMLAKEEAKERVRVTRRSGRSPDDALTPVDLGDLMLMGAPQPEILANTLLYQGGLHSIAGPPDSGKGHPLSTNLLTPEGWRKLGSLNPGDEVIGSSGLPVKITDIYKRGILPVYRVAFSDGASVLCDGDHLWRVQTSKMKNKNGGHYIRSTRELAAAPLQDGGGRLRWYIPICAPVQYQKTPLPVDPYLAGVMLGNAAFTGNGVLSLHWDDREIVDRIKARTGLKVSEYPPTTCLRFRPAKASEIVRKLGQEGRKSPDKFIPDEYFTASEKDRRLLLAGLMDTDGSVVSASSNSAGNAQFHSTSRRLAEGVRELVESLGGVSRIYEDTRERNIHTLYLVSVLLPENPFLVTRKASRWTPPKRGISRAITSIALEGEEEVWCIRVDAEDSLYLTERHIVTHNTSMALWWAAKLLREGKSVLFLDEEGGGDVVSEKLIAMGVSPMESALLSYIPFPGRTWTDEDVDALCRLTEKVTPAMVLFDSSAAFMARAGLDENQASDVTGWWSRVATPLARDFGAAVLVIDHDTKSSEGSRYARGSGAKLAAIDTQLKVEIVKPFTRQQAGILKLRVSKDRRGWLDRDWRVMVRSVDGRMEMHFTLADEDGNRVPDMPPARAKIYEQLTDIPQTWQEINEAVNRTHSHYLRRETLSTELNELLRTGLISRCGGGMGAGDFARWKLPD